VGNRGYDGREVRRMNWEQEEGGGIGLVDKADWEGAGGAGMKKERPVTEWPKLM
jgi:hypothetical protein